MRPATSCCHIGKCAISSFIHCRRSWRQSLSQFNSGWLMPMHYNKSQQVSQLSTCLRYSFNYKRHEHTFCHHFDIETFRGVRAPQPGNEWTSNGKHWFHTGYVDMSCLICSYSNPKLRPEWFNQQKNVWEVSFHKATNTRNNFKYTVVFSISVCERCFYMCCYPLVHLGWEIRSIHATTCAKAISSLIHCRRIQKSQV